MAGRVLRTYWRCLDCAERGVYEHTALGETLAKGSAARHTKDTGHATTTSLHPIPKA